MIITDIQKQKHNEKRYSVFVDGEYMFAVTDIDLLFYKLEIGGVLSAEKLNEITLNNAYIKAKNTAVRFLGYRMRSRKEIYDRLKRDDFSEEIIEKTIAFLTEYGYIDDRKFAEAYITEKKRLRGYGGIRIKHELYEKGVRGEIIEELSELLCDSDTEAVKAAIEKKLKGGRISDRKELQKLYAYLYRKGFSYEISKRALEEYEEETENSDYYGEDEQWQ